MGASSSDIYEAVLALSRSIAGRNDLSSLLSGVAESLQRIVAFDFAALILHDREANSMCSYVLDAAAPADMGPARCFPVEQDPAGWVWTHQEPVVIPRLEGESRWPEFTEWVSTAGLRSLTLVPLTAGDNRLGAFGFGCLAPFAPSRRATCVLGESCQRVRGCSRVFPRQAGSVTRTRPSAYAVRRHESPCLETLARRVVRRAISTQLSRVVRHDYAILTLWNEKTRELDTLALHFTGPALFDERAVARAPGGIPSAEALATGKPVVAYATDVDRYPSPAFSPVYGSGMQVRVFSSTDHRQRAPRNARNRPDHG